MLYGNLENKLSILIRDSVEKAFGGFWAESAADSPKYSIDLETPKTRAHGDIATNVALKLSRALRKNPLEIAAAITENMRNDIKAGGLKRMIEKVEVKEPGFINISLHTSYLHKVLLDIKRQKAKFGSNSIGRNQKVNIEFVSANPTGPLTIAHGRQAAFGDSLGNIFEACGYRVCREYYVNDKGRQIDLLGASIRIRYRELFGASEQLPEDGYRGAYVVDIAKDLRKRSGKKLLEEQDIKKFARFGAQWIMRKIKKDLKDFGVMFDVWFSQKKLEADGKVERALRALRSKGFLYEKNQAEWFASTKFGDDKDRVVRKSDGALTYLAPDIAYHYDKFKRRFRRFVDIWGPDHHGYVSRIKAAVRALGCREGALSVLLVQLATVFRDGKPLVMSTRMGEFITLREVMDEVGKDVTRICFLMRKLDSHLNFDLAAVKKQSLDNPVYYVQYAHARICSILRKAKNIEHSTFNSGLLKEEEELDLLRMMRLYPIAVQSCAKNLEPYGILSYLQELAAAFHNFYDKQRVVSEDLSLTRSRLVLVECVKTVLANGLRLLGVSLPERM
ncbi:MAG: arginine--tRNA ligase [Candidatus Omnitrophota bacterium]